MWKQDTLTSGINDEELWSGINDQDLDEDFDQDEDLDEDQDQDDNQDDDEDHDQDKNQDKDDQKPKQPVDWKKKFYQTTNLQNRQLNDLKKEINQLKNSKTLSDEDLNKIKEKYDEEDLGIIEKIIERKANEILDNRQQTSLAQREMNIFLKEHPELDEPEIKHIKSLQKEYWYSLKKAYTILFGRNDSDRDIKQKPKHSISNSFWWDNNNRSSKQNASKEDEKAFKDMDAFLS